MSAVELIPAPTIFATDVEKLEIVGGACVRYTLVEEIGEERRIVAYVVYPIGTFARVRSYVNAWIARMGIAEAPPIPDIGRVTVVH